MKPTLITENEEFKAGMEETYSTEGLPIKQMAEIIGRKIDYQLGAKAAQSILQKEAWIKTTEKLPEPETNVLAFNPITGTHLLFLTKSGKWRYEITGIDAEFEITHWQALPKHPNDWSWINRAVDKIKCANTRKSTK